MRSPLHVLVRKIVFWVGDTRRLSVFPWVTWDCTNPKITLDEATRELMPVLKPGDIIVSRHDGFLSNIGIGGVFIHAGVYVGNDYVVEALSEGVVKHHVLNILHSDCVAILRPQFDDPEKYDEATKEACEWAIKCVGCEYDELFRFDVAEERKALLLGLKDDVDLACTEVALLCYWKYADDLGIKTRKNINIITRFLSWWGVNTGEDIVTADMYLAAKTGIIMASSGATATWARALGMDESLIKKLESAPHASGGSR